MHPICIRHTLTGGMASSLGPLRSACVVAYLALLACGQRNVNEASLRDSPQKTRAAAADVGKIRVTKNNF